VGNAGRRLRGKVTGERRNSPPPIQFTESQNYWEERYRVGGNSGAGSYGRLARFKAEFLNRFVNENGIETVVEFGSGDGAQLSLAKYPRYLGVDVSATAVELCRSIYADRPGFEFIHTSALRPDMRAELSLSLDVIYHLVEDAAYFAYMDRLFDSALRYVIVYSSNWDEHPVPHVRHRRFTDWVASNKPQFNLKSFEANPYPANEADPDNTSFADFYVYERSGD
jgi:hypothetical protein